jgi:hypothetical protein
MMGPIYSVQSRKQLSTCCSAVWLPSRCGVLCLNVLTSLSFLLMYTWPSAEVTKSSRAKCEAGVVESSADAEMLDSAGASKTARELRICVGVTGKVGVKTGNDHSSWAISGV